MGRLENYLFRNAAVAFVASTAALTAIMWLIGALRQIDLLTSKGQTLVVFFVITALSLPFVLATIAPIALFGSVLYVLNRLNGDSELIVMSASGASPSTLLRPFAILSTLVCLGLGLLHGVAIPSSSLMIEDFTKHVHADFIANFAKAGAFNQPVAGFVFHFRERGPEGSLRGVFIQDRRNPKEISTFIAEVGELVEKQDDVYLILRKGSAQRPGVAGDSSLVTFDDYAIDLSQFFNRAGPERPRPRNRDLISLLRYDPAEPGEAGFQGQVREELYGRLTSPLYALAAGAIAFAALGQARTTRQGRGIAIFAAIILFAAVRIFGFADALMIHGKGGAPPAAWVLISSWAAPLAAATLGLDVAFGGPLFSALRRLSRKPRPLQPAVA